MTSSLSQTHIYFLHFSWNDKSFCNRSLILKLSFLTEETKIIKKLDIADFEEVWSSVGVPNFSEPRTTQRSKKICVPLNIFNRFFQLHLYLIQLLYTTSLKF